MLFLRRTPPAQGLRSQTVRHTGTSLMKGLGGRMAGELKTFSCHGERGHYDPFRPKTLRVECGRGRGAKGQFTRRGSFCRDWMNRSSLKFDGKLSAS